MGKKSKWATPSKGRRKGVPNLKRSPDGGYINKHGVKFTEAEKKRLESLVTRVNQKRKKQLEEASNLPRMVGGKDTGETMRVKYALGDEPDFILSKRVKGLQRYERKSDFNRYIKNLETVLNPKYELERKRLYKRNYYKAMVREFGDPEEFKDITNKIRRMNPDKFIKMVNSEESMEISFIYSPPDKQAKLNEIRGALGLPLHEDGYEEIPDFEE